MDVPLEISFHNIDSSDAVEAAVREHVDKLDKRYGLVSCRVAIKVPHRQHRQGNIPVVRIELSVPGEELVVSRPPHRPRERYHEPDVYVVLKDAFGAAERQLKAFKQRQRSGVKQHDAPLVGQVIGLRTQQDYGFLRSAEGRELWFHRNSLLNDDFDELRVGDRVQYVEILGETGPQASKVWLAPNEADESPAAAEKRK